MFIFAKTINGMSVMTRKDIEIEVCAYSVESCRNALAAATLALGAGSTLHVSDSFVSAGINQTQHRVCIRFTVEMSAILPGYSTSVDVTDEVCVAQTLIVGQVPEFYAQNG